METVTLSTKGQLVLPKVVRDALHLKPGNRLNIILDGERIVISPEGEANSLGWQPLNPSGAKLNAKQLSQPVDLNRATRRR